MAQMIKVWVGFMDTVPVIGTLKEGVDWALALYEENPEVVKEQIKSLKTNMYMSPNLREIEQIMLEELEREATAEPELIKVNQIYVSIIYFFQFLCKIQSHLSCPKYTSTNTYSRCR